MEPPADPAAAIALCRRVIATGRPDQKRAAFAQLGAVLLQAGDAAGAADALRACLALAPGDAAALYNLALAHAALGAKDQARAALAEALARRPDFAEARNNLGLIKLADGDLEGALRDFDAILAVKKDFADAWFNRGIALRALGRGRESGEAFAQAARARPGFAAAHANHGRALHDDGQFAGAEEAYTRALQIAPALPEARANRAALFAETGHLAEAIADYETAHRAAPQDCEMLASLLHARQQACDWNGLAPLTEVLLKNVRAGGTAPPFALAAVGAPGGLQTANAGRWASMVAPLRGAAPPFHAGHPRIRLGYLSGDFHDHATAHLTAALFEQHDRQAFAVHGYSYGPDDNSPMRRRLAAAFDDFLDVRDWSDAAVAERIRADAIDIVIDLKGYTAGARPQIPALRPAPVQVNWLGFPGSMGVDFIDYVIADAVLAPFWMQADCVERIVHLPVCFQPNDARRPVGGETARAAHHLPGSGFVFCCFNNAYKITPEIFAIWMRLLRDVAGSVLWLLDTNAAARENLRRAAGAGGIDPARLVFAPRLANPDHLARHRLADLFLDTLPVNALTTASDALYAGLPVLTCLGETVAGRGCASLLHALGMDELVAASLGGYEDMARMLAAQPQDLRALREKLAGARLAAPLFDTARFAADLENCYRAMLGQPR